MAFEHTPQAPRPKSQGDVAFILKSLTVSSLPYEIRAVQGSAPFRGTQKNYQIKF